jgi:hypothetical protein
MNRSVETKKGERGRSKPRIMLLFHRSLYLLLSRKLVVTVAETKCGTPALLSNKLNDITRLAQLLLLQALRGSVSNHPVLSAK